MVTEQPDVKGLIGDNIPVFKHRLSKLLEFAETLDKNVKKSADGTIDSSKIDFKDASMHANEITVAVKWMEDIVLNHDPKFAHERVYPQKLAQFIDALKSKYPRFEYIVRGLEFEIIRKTGWGIVGRKTLILGVVGRDGTVNMNVLESDADAASLVAEANGKCINLFGKPQIVKIVPDTKKSIAAGLAANKPFD